MIDEKMTRKQFQDHFIHLILHVYRVTGFLIDNF